MYRIQMLASSFIYLLPILWVRVWYKKGEKREVNKCFFFVSLKCWCTAIISTVNKTSRKKQNKIKPVIISNHCAVHTKGDEHFIRFKYIIYNIYIKILRYGVVETVLPKHIYKGRERNPFVLFCFFFILLRSIVSEHGSAIIGRICGHQCPFLGMPSSMYTALSGGYFIW